MLVRNGAAFVRKFSSRSNLLIGTAAVALLALPAYANPLGGTVTTGSASISSPSKSATAINQTSEGVVIDWSSFNIGGGQTTTFVQPNAQAIAVNRIGSASASQILGTLDANGRVVIINGNGLLFGKNAKVNVGSLIATSTDGSDSDVLAGKFSNAGNQNASIVNRGAITAASHGTVALVAPNVSNKGIVEAKLGTVSLGGANAFTVDFKGDGLVSFAAQGDVNGAASVVNTGKLVGANIAMTAHTAEDVATGVVSTSGTIVAKAAHAAGGTILLDAGNGSLTTGGRIDAAGKTGGGAIETSGNAVSIGGKITAGLGGNWKVDPEDLTIDSTAASTIDIALNAGTNVTEQTTSAAPGAGSIGNTSTGLGDINVDSALSWNTSALLSLDAYHSLNINAPITITGAGQLALQYNDAATDGTMNFDLGPTGFGGSVSYGATNNGGTLSVDGTAYTLLYTATNLQSINSALAGNYALADSLDLTGVTWTSLGTNGSSTVLNSNNGFTGKFEGLGNTISNLSIASTATYIGLFGYTQGTLQDIGLVNADISTTGFNFTGSLVGNLAAGGSVTDAYATGSVTGVNYTGGLIGQSAGNVVNSYADVATIGSQALGGLIGYISGTNIVVTGSYATGNVTASGGYDIGGLIGRSLRVTVNNSYATGTVNGSGSGNVGGLIGLPYGTVSNSYATGNVSSNGGAGVGGLVGLNEATISNSYATGAVSGLNYVGGLVGENESPISTSYSAGQVTGVAGGSRIGGFVGYDWYGGSTQNNYSTGAVIGNNATDVGGFSGFVDGATENDNYSTGAVSGTGTGIGGYLGYLNSGTVTATNYWDTQASGQSVSAAGTPMTTAQLKSGLPTGFSSTYWSIIPNVVYPFLNWQYNLVSGTVLASGGTAKSGDTVDVLVNGASVTPSVTATGPNGTYYLLFPRGTIPASSDLVAYLASGYAQPGNTFVVNASGGQSGVNIEEGVLQITGNVTTASAMLAGLNPAIGSQTGSQFLYTQAGGFPASGDVFFTSTAASFDIDTTLNLPANYLKIRTSGPITESTGIIDTDYLSLCSTGNITLGGANNIINLEGLTTGATGNVDINNASNLAVVGHIDAGYGAGNLTLTSGGAITQSSASVIDAATFSGGFNGNAAFNGANVIQSLGTFTNSSSSGEFSLTDDHNLAITGVVTPGYEADLVSTGTMSESGAGVIDTTAFFGSSAGGATLNGANMVSEINGFTNTGAGGFAFADARRLQINDPIAGGTGDVDLDATGGALVVSASISGDNVTLTSGTASVDQTAGSITATGVLTADAYQNVTLDNLNTYVSESLTATHGSVSGH